MSASRPFIDPEISVLMREIFSNPRAKLFKAVKPRSLPGVLRMTEPVGVNAPGLIPAERHLLQVYRQEVAWLLRQAALTRMYEDPSTGHLLRRNVTVERDLELLTTAQVKIRLEGFEHVQVEGASALTAIGDDCTIAAPSHAIRRLCAHSLNLAPSDEARIYFAVSLGLDGQPDDAIRLLASIESGTSSQFLASYARQNIGLFEAQLGRRGRAQASYRKAVDRDTPRPVPVVLWLHFSARLGDAAQLHDAAQLADSLLPLNHSAVIEHCRAQSSSRLSDLASAVLGRAEQRFGPTSYRLTNVFRESA